MQARTCPLCRAADSSFAFSVGGRSFFECSSCDLLFVGCEHFLDATEERRRYDNHQNLETDGGYVTHLSRLMDVVLPELPAGARGLDFGCGPSPVMARLFEKRGFSMCNYDRVYHPKVPASFGPFDFITCCEVVEHFQRPGDDFALLRSLLKPGGCLGLMTNFREGERRASSWWYLRDPTHVCFYSRRTLEWMAVRYGLELKSMEKDVAVYRG